MIARQFSERDGESCFGPGFDFLDSKAISRIDPLGGAIAMVVDGENA
jgi:hypothetical protein